MGFLLDTNVLSELRRGHLTHPGVLKWQKLQPTKDQWISVISLMEVSIGVVRARKSDRRFSEVLAKWYRDKLVPSYTDRTLPVDVRVAEKRAEYEKLRTVAYSDALIGATAAVNGLTLVTRNTKDFAGLRIPLINPWEHPLD